MEIDITKLSSPPTSKGICIRQYKSDDPSRIAGGIDTLVFLDGKFLPGVQGVSLGVSIDDINIDVKLVMLAEYVDVDILDPRIAITTTESSQHDYQLGSPNPIKKDE